MEPEKFTTHSLAVPEQTEAWRTWYDSVFDTTSLQRADKGFGATNLTWRLDGVVFSRVSTPAVAVVRTKAHIRRTPVDHWAITLSKRGATDVRSRDTSLTAPTGVPYVLSLGEEMYIERGEDERLQLYLSRDRFYGIAPLLDASRGMALNTSQGRLLADYMVLLERNLPNLTPEDGSRLPDAIQAMLSTCLVPSIGRLGAVGRQIDLTLMERVRRAVRRNLRSPMLGPDTLCREAATSRSQLYRLLEGEGGVARYIQRRRLSECFAILCNTSSNFSVAAIAETLCFADASNFSRSFRREFGMSPSDVRAAALAGHLPVAIPKGAFAAGIQSFADCLRA